MTKEDLLRELLSVINEIEFYMKSEVVEGEYVDEIKVLKAKKKHLEKEIAKKIVEEL